jgi:hypothetical protein
MTEFKIGDKVIQRPYDEKIIEVAKKRYGGISNHTREWKGKVGTVLCFREHLRIPTKLVGVYFQDHERYGHHMHDNCPEDKGGWYFWPEELLKVDVRQQIDKRYEALYE